MIKYERIMCNSDSEFIECAKYLIKKGYRITNWDHKNEIFKESLPPNYSWKGFQKDADDNSKWSRFAPGVRAPRLENSIHFKVLSRKEKLEKLNIVYEHENL